MKFYTRRNINPFDKKVSLKNIYLTLLCMCLLFYHLNFLFSQPLFHGRRIRKPIDNELNAVLVTVIKCEIQ